ncbi:MAG TPA: hypothetical protein VFP61_10750 [Acidimicrobiales bacterium]|nr:hypothetical protein [Acidimicrobiales bacterium]
MLFAMASQKWLDRSQPQTLYIATIVMYINAVFALIGGAFLNPLGFVLMAGSAAAGWGVANERKVLYWVGVAVAVLNVALLVAVHSFNVAINLLFAIALLALLLHPLSRSYYRTWFH